MTLLLGETKLFKNSQSQGLNMERRFLKRNMTPSKEKEGVIEGYAVYWDRESDIGGFMEKFARDSLMESEDGVSLYFQHDKKKLLANTKSGTLKFMPDDQGMRYEAKLPESAKDIKELVDRQDIQGVSVGMVVEDDDYMGMNRTIHKAELFELSLVDKPAHETSLSMRGKQKRRPHWSTLIIGV